MVNCTIKSSVPFRIAPRSESSAAAKLPDYYADINSDNQLNFSDPDVLTLGPKTKELATEPVLSFAALEKLKAKAEDGLVAEAKLPKGFVAQAQEGLSQEGLLLPGQQLGIQFSNNAINLVVFSDTSDCNCTNVNSDFAEYQKALDVERSKPDWEDSLARQYWLHWG